MRYTTQPAEPQALLLLQGFGDSHDEAISDAIHNAKTDAVRLSQAADDLATALAE